MECYFCDRVSGRTIKNYIDMPKNEGVKTNREIYLERLKSKYPDKEYADDEAIFGQINDDYDGYDKEIEQYKSDERDLSGMFNAAPSAASFLMEWKKGGDPIVLLIRKYGDDFKAALEDPDKLEQIAAANKDYAERVAKSKEYDDQYERNMREITIPNVDAVQAEDGLSEDEINDAMSFLIQVMKDGLLGKFDKENIRMAVKALKHDEDVEIADREGEVRGRNTRIEEKLRKRGSGDGTPALAGKNGGGDSGRPMPDLGAIGRYDEGLKNIWERGGMRRIHSK